MVGWFTCEDDWEERKHLSHQAIEFPSCDHAEEDTEEEEVLGGVARPSGWVGGWVAEWFA